MYRHVPLYRLYLVYKIGCICKQPVIFDSLFNRKVRTSGTTVHLYGTEKQFAKRCNRRVRASGTDGTKKSVYRGGIFVNLSSETESKIKKNKKFEREGYIYHSTARCALPPPSFILRRRKPALPLDSRRFRWQSTPKRKAAFVKEQPEHEAEHGMCTGKRRGTWNVSKSHCIIIASVKQNVRADNLYIFHSRVHTICSNVT